LTNMSSELVDMIGEDNGGRGGFLPSMRASVRAPRQILRCFGLGVGLALASLV
jgi:hypothetical protein